MPVLKAQNAAIRSSRLGHVLEDFPHPATVANGNNLLVYVNPAFSSLYGWSEQEILGLTPRLLVDSAFPEKQLRAIKRQISSMRTGWCGELENITKAGRKFLIRLWAVPVRPTPDLPRLFHLGVSVPASSNLRPEDELAARLAGAVLAERHSPRPGTERLSRLEQILNLRALGYATKEIAEVLGVAPNSINVALHRGRMRAEGRHGTSRPPR
jgi:PAS domain S-box-containing protein